MTPQTDLTALVARAHELHDRLMCQSIDSDLGNCDERNAPKSDWCVTCTADALASLASAETSQGVEPEVFVPPEGYRHPLQDLYESPEFKATWEASRPERERVARKKCKRHLWKFVSHNSFKDGEYWVCQKCGKTKF